MPHALPVGRSWSQRDRHAKLFKGTRVQIFDSDGKYIVDILLPLFNACSTKQTVLKGNTILLPRSINSKATVKVLQYLLHLTFASSTSPLQLSKQHPDNLQLGMPIYVQHIANHYTRLARNNEISYKIIDIVSNTDSEPGRTIFAEIVRTLGIASFESRMPDPDGFTAYLASNARFHDAITTVQVK